MRPDPQSVLRFAADYYPLLRDLYEARDGLSDAELARLVSNHVGESSPSPDYVVERLQTLGLVEERPGETATLEITQHLRFFLEALLHQHQLTTPEVLTSLLREIESQTLELVESTRAEAPARAQRALDKLNSAVEAVRRFSFGNRVGIVDRVMRLKSDRTAYSVQERFEIIVDIWEHYLAPLQDLIDVHTSTEEAFDRLDRQLVSAVDVFTTHPAVYREVRSARARLTRMRSELAADYRASYDEVLPLYETYKRQSLLYRGASRLLEQLDREGLNSLQLTEHLALLVHRNEGLLSNTALGAYVRAVRGYEPSPPPPLHLPNGDVPTFVCVAEAIDAATAELPIPDALSWCLARYPEQPLRGVLRIYNGLLRHGAFATTVASAEHVYRFGTFQLYAHPLALHHRR